MIREQVRCDDESDDGHHRKMQVGLLDAVADRRAQDQRAGQEDDRPQRPGGPLVLLVGQQPHGARLAELVQVRVCGSHQALLPVGHCFDLVVGRVQLSERGVGGG